MTEKTRYKNPPIVERIVGVYRTIPQETFEAKLPAWKERIAGDYPREEAIAEWEINIEQRAGIPIVRGAHPTAKIIHLFWKAHPKGRKVFGMRVRPDRLVFHLNREDDEQHDFDELFPEMEKWLPIWAEHFGVESLDGTTVEYVNILSAQTTPQFVNKEGIVVGKALNAFAKIPGKHKFITSPYDSKVRLVFDAKMPCVFQFRIFSDDNSKHGPVVRVDFSVETRAVGKAIDPKTALQEILKGHDLMLEQFDCLFTEEAKNSFEPDVNRR